MREAAEVAFKTIVEVAPKLQHIKRIWFVLHSDRDLAVHEEAPGRILGDA